MGYVYVLYNPKSELVKIGKTTNPKERFSSLTNSNGTGFQYYLSPPIYIAILLEKVMLQKYSRYRTKGEWHSSITFEEVMNELKEILNSEDFKRRNVKR